MNAGRILVVDDEAPVRKLIRTCFENDGYTVDEAESMVAARAAMAERRYDLITLDALPSLVHVQQHY